jgi:hypothetical protein
VLGDFGSCTSAACFGISITDAFITPELAAVYARLDSNVIQPGGSNGQVVRAIITDKVRWMQSVQH